MPARSRPTKHLPLLLAAIMLAACSRNPAPIPTPTRQPASASPSSTAADTLPSAVSSSPTPPYEVIHLTPMPQPQLLGTLVSLFETNGGCRFPCWWGITPGQTTWEQALEILGPISYNMVLYPLHKIVSIRGRGPLDVDVLRQDYSVNDDQIITLIETRLAIKDNAYLLTEMVARYGSPTEIVLGTWSQIVGDKTTSYYALFEDQGFLITYDTKTIIKDEAVEVCPFMNQGGYLVMWDINSGSFFDWVLKTAYIFSSGKSRHALLGEVTDLSVDDFIDIYQQPDGCFDTPRSIWYDLQFYDDP